MTWASFDFFGPKLTHLKFLGPKRFKNDKISQPHFKTWDFDKLNRVKLTLKSLFESE